MTVPFTIDAGGWLGKHLEGDDADTDLPRAMLQAFAEALMSAQASMQCGAGHGERSDERVNSRNGYRHRPWDTRVGSIDLAVPKLRSGVYSPEFLLQPRRRAEQALVSVVCQAYVEGVSTRRVDDLVKAMGIEGISKSEVSRMAAELLARADGDPVRLVGPGGLLGDLTKRVLEAALEAEMTEHVGYEPYNRRVVIHFDTSIGLFMLRMGHNHCDFRPCSRGRDWHMLCDEEDAML